MYISFKDKVAVVTGAGAGLGRSYAIFLASRGAKVVVNDLGGSWDGVGQSKTAAMRVVEEIQAAGGKAVPNFDSVADPEAAQNIIRAALDNFGTIDILVCNAGILRDKTFLKMSLNDFDLVMKVHLMGTVYTARAAFPVMKEKSYGRIVMTTSVAGLFGNFGQTNYSTAKMGIIGFMNSLKLEAQKYNILINTIAPSAATRLNEPSGFFPKEISPFLRSELVTAMVAYLCSDQCQSTGYILSAGGGYFSRVQIVEGQGIRFDPSDDITPEIIFENFSKITDMKNAVGHFSATDGIKKSLGFLFKRKPGRGEKEGSEK
ncbi:MAG: SDR family oxidoreductase [Syntrophaceae bacterium]|nr:SDR family oxidoreductase [Syntrophaceae bacterium]